MIATEQSLEIRIKRLPLLELVGFSVLITGLTLLIWWWYVAGMERVATTLGVEPLWSVVLLDRTLVALLAASEFFCVLALLMGITPLGWWLEAKSLPIEKESAVTWLAGRIQAATTSMRTTVNPIEAQMMVEAPAASTADQNQPILEEPASAAGESGYPNQVAQPQAEVGAAPGQPATSQDTQAGQPQNQPQEQSQQTPDAQQPAPPQNANAPGTTAEEGTANAATPTPGAQSTQPHNGQPPASEDAAEPPSTTMPSAEELLGGEEEDALADLTDVGSMLAAFQLEEEVDPWLAELSASLDEVDTDEIVVQAESILHGLRAGKRRGEKHRGPRAPIAAAR